MSDIIRITDALVALARALGASAHVHVHNGKGYVSFHCDTDGRAEMIAAQIGVSLEFIANATERWLFGEALVGENFVSVFGPILWLETAPVDSAAINAAIEQALQAAAIGEQS
jgi:hypothetical protein